MSEGALDASALLAFLNDEPGAEDVEAALVAGTVMSTVNWAEVLGKVAREGGNAQELTQRLTEQGILHNSLQLIPFTEDDALLVAQLTMVSRPFGLSLGDKACLALAKRLDLSAITTDRIWASVPVDDVQVRVIR